MAEKNYPPALAEDVNIQQLHERAVEGDDEAKASLLLWVYFEARRYYKAKTFELGNFSAYEAQELASQFLVNFVASWRGVNRVTNYTRRGLKLNLMRYLATRRADTISIEDLDVETLRTLSAEPAEEPWMTWSDEAFDLYAAIALEYYANSEKTVQLVEARIGDPEMPYTELCSDLGISEGAARMRVWRFFGRVRQRLRENGKVLVVKTGVE